MLEQLRERLLVLPALEKRQKLLQAKLREAQDEVRRLHRQHEKEKRDVELIEKNTFSKFLRQLSGTYDKRRDKEHREEYAAKLAYDQAAAHQAHLANECNEMAARIRALRADAQQYEKELDARRAQLTACQPQGQEYAKLEAERARLAAQKAEIGEAMQAARRASNTAADVLNSLDDAKGWATWDMLSRGGLISGLAKYDHIDKAEAAYHHLQAQLKDLAAVLQDIGHGGLFNASGTGFEETDRTTRTIDIWFDNIFTDWAVRDRISENISAVKHLQNRLHAVISTLDAKMAELEKAYTSNRQAEEALLVKL